MSGYHWHQEKIQALEASLEAIEADLAILKANTEEGQQQKQAPKQGPGAGWMHKATQFAAHLLNKQYRQSEELAASWLNHEVVGRLISKRLHRRWYSQPLAWWPLFFSMMI